MIYVTGDTHGDFRKFDDRNIKRLKKNDILIICGDFGFIWDGSVAENRILKAIGDKRFTTLFVDGTHENFDLLNEYEEVEWHGGKAHHIIGNLYHLMRGQIFDIYGKKFFTFGGGESKDKDMKIAVNRWWKEEMPTLKEMKESVKLLNNFNRQVDYVITHEPPSNINKLLNLEEDNVNILGKFFNDLAVEVKYEKWFFGSCHIDRNFSSRYHAVFNSIVPIELLNKVEV